MSRINQPPAPVLPNAGRTIDAGMKTTTAPQQAAAQPQGRAAAAQDGFTAQAAAPMVLNPQAQAPRREVLPSASTNPKRPPTQQQLRDMVTKAFHEQYGKNATATEGFIQQWMDEAMKIYEKEGTTQFLFEKVFSAMNKAATAGQTSPLPQQNFTQRPTDDQLKAAVEFAFKQKFNDKPTDNEMKAWMAEALKIFEKDKTSQFLGEKLFTALQNASNNG